MIRYLFSFLMLCVLLGCNSQRYVDFFPCHDDGTVKPRVVLLPMRDSSNCKLSWDIGRELISAVRYELMDRGSLYLYSENTVHDRLLELGAYDFFNSDAQFARYFGGADFIILTELIDHTFVSNGILKKGCMMPYTLNMKVQVRILDLRCTPPQVILQEIVTKNPVASRVYHFCPDEVQDVTSFVYQTSGLGRLHRPLICTLTERFEDTIKSAY